ncbi:hypothetical protein RND71_024990 [Anisodus tanguticus]|uniref:Uncharacterized protein n=1 Tax=Anisodus tanguticus TaxID=243964 RepID=A0AAE1VC73_9SOLA|nr:hypothetical protein RND71_024990 [Anisodus tanguticus]
MLLLSRLRPSNDEAVKSFSIEKFRVRMPLDEQGDLNGDIVVKSVMGKPFDNVRKTLQEKDLETFFRATCFGVYLDLPEDNNARFQMTIVYGLVIHPWLIPIIRELNMPCVITLRPMESVPEELIDKIKEELTGATTIIRESRAGVVDVGDVNVGDGEGDVVDLDIVVDVAKQTMAGLVDKRRGDDDGVGGGVSGYTPVGGDLVDIPLGGGGGVGGYTPFGGGGRFGGYTPLGGGGQTIYIPYRLGRYSSVGVGTSKVPSCACECNTCKKKMDYLIKKVEDLTQAQKDTKFLLQ